MGDRGGQLFIRGGEPSQNLALLDGIPIYQPSHIVGFYSAFPSEIISRADIYAGGFGPKYSGRISSVIDVYTRGGNKLDYETSASVSPFTASLLAEGPLVKNYVSFIAFGRRSVLNQIGSVYGAEMPFDFSDGFGKIQAVIAPNQQVSASVFQSRDRGTLTEENLFWINNEIRWRNSGYGVRYIVSPRAVPMFGEATFSVADFESELGSPKEPARTSDVHSIGVQVHLKNFTRKAEVEWGFFLREVRLRSVLGGLFQNLETNKDFSVQTGGYVAPDFDLGRGMHIQPGIAAHVFGTDGFFAEPRIRMRWRLGVHQISAAAGLYRQEVVGLVDRRDATGIFTAWIETPLGKVSRAVHAVIGYHVAPSPSVELSIEPFYKKLNNLFVTEWTPFPRFTTTLQDAAGRSAGLDIRVEARLRRAYAILTYGYSNTTYDLQETGESQRHLTYRPPHDRHHQFNVVVNVSMGGFDANARWSYGSGLPFNEVRGFDGFILMDGAVDVDAVKGMPRIIYARPFGGVLPSVHRLDVFVERTFSGKLFSLTVKAGAINAYDRKNVFSLDLFTLERTDQLRLTPILGIQLRTKL